MGEIGCRRPNSIKLANIHIGDIHQIHVVQFLPRSAFHPMTSFVASGMFAVRQFEEYRVHGSTCRSNVYKYFAVVISTHRELGVHFSPSLMKTFCITLICSFDIALLSQHAQDALASPDFLGKGGKFH